MKYALHKRLLAGALSILLLASCSKQYGGSPSASLLIANAVVGSDPFLIPNFGGTQPLPSYLNGIRLIYGLPASENHYSFVGTENLTIYHYPDTTVKDAPLFNLMIDLKQGSMCTLFLTGTISSPDTLLTTDNLPYYPVSDSSLGIRFLNLSQGSGPISVNIAGKAAGSEVNSLAYKGSTEFRKYAAPASIDDYNFEFRDAATGALLATYDFSGINSSPSNQRSKRYKNFNLALIGTPGSASGLSVMYMENYSQY